MKINITIIILLIFTTSAFACNGTENELEHSLKHYKYTIDGPFNIKEMESRNLIRTNKGLLPFGKVNKEWVATKNLYKKGDEFFSISIKNVRFLHGKHVLVRKGCILAVIVIASA